ncbi:Hypothetical predicted protein [Mytilus galloprovincialis]|uniref:TRIM2_3 n=1 Tax=Mytilus galloprovincialis TaxID=29158 RepID=A0A8B6EYF5_MYTGA|nr:Hypothetical predicted protein [Mytilus galloprovincialis]
MEAEQNSTAILLPINLEAISKTEEVFTQAQVSVRDIHPVSFNLRQQLNIRLPRKDIQNIYSCITIGNSCVFTDYYNNQLTIYNTDGTDAHHISLSNKPLYITKVDSSTVAVSCTGKTILMINMCTGSVTSSIETSGRCYGIEYDENNLYVVTDKGINMMDLTGKFKRTIPVPSVNINDISVYRDKLVCLDNRSIYCCSLDGQLEWQFKNDQFQSLRRVTTDGEGNVYATDQWTNTIVVVFEHCNQYRDILTGLDGLDKPCGIHFDKKENFLLVSNAYVGKAFLFDIKKKLA